MKKICNKKLIKSVFHYTILQNKGYGIILAYCVVVEINSKSYAKYCDRNKLYLQHRQFSVF